MFCVQRVPARGVYINSFTEPHNVLNFVYIESKVFQSDVIFWVKIGSKCSHSNGIILIL